MILPIITAVALASPLATAPAHVQDLAACIRQHESRHDYRAENPRSTASGAYQFLDGTWRGNAKWTKQGGKYIARQYQRASDAPPAVQDAVFLHSIRNGGHKNWRGTGCPGTE